jgi:hypothetical protein
LFYVAKKSRVGPLGDFDDTGFVPALTIEVLIQLETLLSNVHGDRTVLDNAVILRLSENGAPDAVLAQVLELAMDGSLGHETQQVP